MGRALDVDGPGDGPQRREVFLLKESRCRFCRDKVDRVDYKDVLTLEGLCRSRGRIIAGKRSGTCSRHQRMVKQAIKQARFIGLLSYTDAPQRGGFSPRRPW
jgi:small subunit ribosomal protein S18